MTGFPRGEEADSEHWSPYTLTTLMGSELRNGGNIDGTSKEHQEKEDQGKEDPIN